MDISRRYMSEILSIQRKIMFNNTSNQTYKPH